mgnify:CR=1 FL=1
MKDPLRHHIPIDQRTGFPADTGCNVAPLCTECPLPMCKHDDPKWYIGWQRQQRRLFEAQGVARVKVLLADLPKERAVELAAEEFHVTGRTVYRYLEREGK